MIAVNGTGKQSMANNGQVMAGCHGGDGGGEGLIDTNERGDHGRNVGHGEVVVRSQRRQFTKAYKRQILAEADKCQYGELGALLRREGLYSSNLSSWRRELALGKLAGNKRKKKEESRVAKLVKENERLQKELSQAQAIIVAQKKLAALIDMMNESE